MPAMLGSYHRIVAAAKNQATWLLLIDSDEFMYAASPTANVATTLKALEARHPLTGQVDMRGIGSVAVFVFAVLLS